jgi:RimJ/RimL family protein N-acetyltransferase
MSQPLAVPVLVDERVRLRPHTMADLGPVLERCLDPLTRRFTTIPLDYTEAMAHHYLSALLEPSAQLASWAIEADGGYAGTIDLRVLPVDAGAGDLGFVTHPAYRGQGLMSSAVSLVVGHAFDTLGWQFVQWRAHVGNWGSLKAAWRCGFPVPTAVPSLLVERGEMVDGWISTLRAGAPREPVAPWDKVYAALSPPGSR